MLASVSAATSAMRTPSRTRINALVRAIEGATERDLATLSSALRLTTDLNSKATIEASRDDPDDRARGDRG